MGSDYGLIVWLCLPVYFNPRSRMGSDITGGGNGVYTDSFQSTLPHGERPASALIAGHCTIDFNPRSRMGSDILLLLIICFNQNFNPRSRMGSDVYRVPPRASRSYFNPRSRMGSDSALCTTVAASVHFNPRSRMGSD